MRTALLAVLLAAVVPDDDKPLKIQMVPQDSPGHWQAQLLGDLDRPVGEKIEFHFFAPTHSVVQGSFDNPCQPIGPNAFFSGGISTLDSNVNVSHTRPPS